MTAKTYNPLTMTMHFEGKFVGEMATSISLPVFQDVVQDARRPIFTTTATLAPARRKPARRGQKRSARDRRRMRTAVAVRDAELDSMFGSFFFEAGKRGASFEEAHRFAHEELANAVEAGLRLPVEGTVAVASRWDSKSAQDIVADLTSLTRYVFDTRPGVGLLLPGGTINRTPTEHTFESAPCRHHSQLRPMKPAPFVAPSLLDEVARYKWESIPDSRTSPHPPPRFRPASWSLKLQHGGVCLGCERFALLRPVDVVVLVVTADHEGLHLGGPARLQLCGQCRLGWRDTRDLVLLSTLLHSPVAKVRWRAMECQGRLDDE